jgi:hypothetical protein
VIRDFANIVDHFVLEQSKPEERSFAQDLYERIIGFLTTSLHTASASLAPTAPASYADMAKTLRNSGADLRSAKAPRPPPPAGKGPTLISTYTEKEKKRDDRRLLVTVEKRALLSRPEPFALRQELCKATGLSLANIPQIAPTRTRWAITPADLTTRDLLTSQENTEAIIRIL